MASLLLVTEDNGFATAAEALSNADLTVTRAHAEEAVAVAKHDLPDVLAIDTDSIVEAKPPTSGEMRAPTSYCQNLPGRPRRASQAPTARPMRNGSRIWFAPGRTPREQWCRFAADGAIQRRGRPAPCGDRARPRHGRARRIDAFGHRSPVPGIPFDQGARPRGRSDRHGALDARSRKPAVAGAIGRPVVRHDNSGTADRGDRRLEGCARRAARLAGANQDHRGPACRDGCDRSRRFK